MLRSFYCIFGGNKKDQIFYDSLVCLEYAGHMICFNFFVINWSAWPKSNMAASGAEHSDI